MSFEEIVHALAGPRTTIFYTLVECGPTTISKIASGIGLALSTVSSHISVLRSAGLVRTWQDGKFVWVAALASEVELVVHWHDTRTGEPGAPGEVDCERVKSVSL